MGMKVTYNVPKRTYAEVMEYVACAQEFFMVNGVHSFSWECAPQEDETYIVTVTVDEEKTRSYK